MIDCWKYVQNSLTSRRLFSMKQNLCNQVKFIAKIFYVDRKFMLMWFEYRQRIAALLKAASNEKLSKKISPYCVLVYETLYRKWKTKTSERKKFRCGGKFIKTASSYS